MTNDPTASLPLHPSVPPSLCPSIIFLVGYRGSGKSTVARLLADRLGWSWIDADDAIERHAGMSIRHIFEMEGEAGFRRRESAILEELCRLRNYVIATGGGAVLSAANRERLKASGRIVWLTADVESIRHRLEGDHTTRERRPALTVGGLAEIEELLRVREPLYRAVADHIVDTSGREPLDIVAEIVQAMTPSRARSAAE